VETIGLVTRSPYPWTTSSRWSSAATPAFRRTCGPRCGARRGRRWRHAARSPAPRRCQGEGCRREPAPL